MSEMEQDLAENADYLNSGPTEDLIETLCAALKRCVEVIEGDVFQLRAEGFEGASWQLSAINGGRAALNLAASNQEGA